MNSEQIKKELFRAVQVSDPNNGAPSPAVETTFWLKEIAYHLAVMNERASAQPTFVITGHGGAIGPGPVPELGDQQKDQNR